MTAHALCRCGLELQASPARQFSTGRSRMPPIKITILNPEELREVAERLNAIGERVAEMFSPVVERLRPRP